jgi:hypothetical protein
MNAVVDLEEERFTTQVAPDGPLDGQEFVPMPAGNNPEVFVVYKTEFGYDLGYSRTRFIGAYWSGDTARSVAATFGAQFTCLEIGLIPTITLKDLH